MTEWGVPDWTDASAYPAPIGRGRMLVWAWEFLRRNHEYRIAWSNLLNAAEEEEGPSAEPFDILDDEQAREFGLVSFVRNPTLAKHPRFAVSGIRRLGRASDRRPHAINLSEFEIGYMFDLTMPLEGQFARALKDAKGLQSKRVAQKELQFKNPRERSDNYVEYLRILDAEDAGVEENKVADALFPSLTNSYPDYQRNGALRNHKRAAHRYRDSDYRMLAALAIAPKASK